ncbi:hypothetical protein ACIQ1H_13105 [Lysinibacillus sp. NPDC097279]|uniref:hypothetical protein n=1 Tax=Lysinibacillus sp. NPDC097279 TaxID=3364143 RepID=UPI0037F2103A
MKRLSLPLVTSTFLISMLFTPVLTETVNAKEVDQKVESTVKFNKNQKKKDNTNEMEAKKVDTKIESASQLKSYLKEKYPELITEIVTVKFEYKVIENDDLKLPYDYFINYHLSLSPWELNFESAMNKHLRSIKYQDTAKEDVAKARQQLNDFIETMAKDVIEKMPNKKILGQNYEDWYTYPNIKIGLQSLKKYSWTNYEPLSMNHVWVERPEDYDNIMRSNSDPSSPTVIQYSREELERYNYTIDYFLLKYNDFKITEFGWRKFLDGYNKY